ncbi:hypothetical protein G6F24_003344 [Rhizopus arrhizus]|nr:hypothetical protein G6F24_003344 [Rhizopus arrhizus]
MTEITQVDVLVSGAGPVGLYFSYLMALRGHSVYCLDPKIGPTDQSRALLVTSRTMEILEGKGLAGEFLADGFISSGIRVFRDTLFPHMTAVMQSRTEYILTDHLEKSTSCQVHWENELISYTQDDEKVISIVLDKKTGQEHKVQSRYIIGADGSHSRVRKGCPDFTYEGVAIDTKFFLADLTIEGENIKNMRDRMNMFVTHLGFMGMVPINPCSKEKEKEHVFRVFANLEAYQRSETNQNNSTHGLTKKNEAPTLEFIQSFIDKATAPLKFETKDLIWSSYFKINERMANNYRHKRAFLMGDAAHCHSPAGGQGMNLGLQDADNLAWKLSDVLNGYAVHPDELLDSYHAERYPHASATIKTTGNATQTGLSEGYIMKTIRETAIQAAFVIPQIREYAFKNTMQLYVTIDASTSKILGTSDKGLIKPGYFLPDTEPLRQHKFGKRLGIIPRLNLRETLIQNDKFAVIFIGTCYSGANPNKDLMAAFWKYARSYPVKRIVVESSWHVHFNHYPDFVLQQEEHDAQSSFYSEERLDSTLSLTSRSGLLSYFPKYLSGPTPSAVLFVRPDLYVAQSKIVYNKDDLKAAMEYLNVIYVNKE